MHILVVEDEQRLGSLLRRVLLEERHTVDLAHEGNTGLNLALSNTYDVVILDLMLPGMDGLEICRQMRAEHVMSPVLMLTARGAVEDRVTGLNAGADDYLTKPFAMLEDIVAEVNHMGRLATNLLTLARLDSVSLHREHEVVSLAELAQESARRVQALAKLRGITVEVECSDNPYVIGDPMLLQQAVLVLLDNAIKYNRHDGRVTVRTVVQDQQVRLEVDDTGIGIASEHLPRLGERFYRVDKARSRKAGGTGLGLSIARNIALTHGGQLAVSSVWGQGTTVTLTLPLAHRSPMHTEATRQD